MLTRSWSWRRLTPSCEPSNADPIEMSVVPLLVPQVNVNDETVLLARWCVPQYAEVAAGQVVCEVETTRAASEITAEHSGVLVQVAAADSRVGIGRMIGAIGPTRQAVDEFIECTRSAPPAPVHGLQATPKA